MPRMKRKFLRRDWNKMLRLGGRRKKLKWRRSKGRHAKIRQKWKGYSQMPSVGYKSPRSTRGFVENKKSVMINNIHDLMRLKSNEIGIVSKTIGQKKKIDIAKKALETKADLLNFDASKYLDEIRKKQEIKKPENKPEKKEKKESGSSGSGSESQAKKEAENKK